MSNNILISKSIIHERDIRLSTKIRDQKINISGNDNNILEGYITRSGTPFNNIKINFKQCSRDEIIALNALLSEWIDITN